MPSRARSARRQAWEKGHFEKSVIPVKDQNGLTILDRDEHMRPDSDMQSLASLNASFQMVGEMGGFDAVAVQAHPEVEAVRHVHHAGNSSGIVDGAAGVILGSKRGGRTMGLDTTGQDQGLRQYRLRPGADADGPGRRNGEAPEEGEDVAVGHRSLRTQRGVCRGRACRYMQHFAIPHDRINVNGGAIAMGHPLGATGAMIFGTVLDELERRDLGTALVTLCIGAGMGTATIIERV